MGTLFNSAAAIEPDYMRKKKAAERQAGRSMTNQEFEAEFLKLGGVGACLIQALQSSTQY